MGHVNPVTDSDWDFVEKQLATQKSAEAVFVRKRFADAKVAIQQKGDDGELLLVKDPQQSNTVIAVAGVTCGCMIVKVHFYCVLERHVGTRLHAIELLCRKVREFGAPRYYGCVCIPCCVDLAQCEQTHYLAPRSRSTMFETLPDKTRLVWYTLTKQSFESLLHS